ncbi:hypothetical protein BV898_04599 [Hypsibius exemplaris]|uniref:Uncharacterized protein n=1 Tax=Hypsibius exemplaris TaxID=2072580 RepID=A0A1W0X1X8_HYPEX|nr:hypothetical protein BV898_04599 [Hypsibius exemplaris]
MRIFSGLSCEKASTQYTLGAATTSDSNDGGSSTTKRARDEHFTLFRIYVDGAVHEPAGTEEPTPAGIEEPTLATVKDYRQNRSTACSSPIADAVANQTYQIDPIIVVEQRTEDATGAYMHNVSLWYIPFLLNPKRMNVQPDIKREDSPGGAAVGGLISADFIPNCIRPGSFLSWAEFEPFSVILQRANQWLTQNGTLEIRTCETVEFNTHNSGEIVNVINSSYVVSGEGASRYVRGLRLWMQPRMDGGSVVQQIGYFNILPSVQVGFFNTEVSHRLDSLIHQTNEMFATNPIQGRIITIETVSLKVSSNGTDPDCTSWTERGAGSTTFAYMLRIFYIQGPPAMELIGVADFVPGVLGEGGLFSRPVLEPFPQVLGKAHQWLLQQSPAFRLVNVQTLLHKQRWTTGQIDTLRMVYTERDLHSYYVRYLRLAYVIPNQAYGTAYASGSHSGPVRLNFKLFVPGMLEPPACCTTGTFEDQLQVRERVSVWMRATGAKVIAVETIPMRIFSGAELREGFNTMHTWNATTTHSTGQSTRQAKAAELYLTLYRVYIDGTYPEPFGGPTLPSVEDYMRERATACTIL